MRLGESGTPSLVLCPETLEAHPYDIIG